MDFGVVSLVGYLESAADGGVVHMEACVILGDLSLIFSKCVQRICTTSTIYVKKNVRFQKADSLTDTIRFKNYQRYSAAIIYGLNSNPFSFGGD